MPFGERMNLTMGKIEDLLPLFLMFGVLVLMLIFFQRKLSRIRSEKAVASPHDLPLRGPGESILDRIDRSAAELAAFGVAAAVLPLVLLLTYISYLHFSGKSGGWMDLVYLVCLSVGFIPYGVNKLRRINAKIKRLRRVYAGVQAVALEINRLMLSGYHVYHDFPSGRFHIDHVIIGPTGVFTVQSRIPSCFDRGNLRRGDTISAVGNALSLSQTTDTVSIQTTAFHASWLANWLLTATGEALRVQPLLTLPGWTIDCLDEQEVIVVEAAGIKGVVRTTSINPLTSGKIQRLCAEIETKYRRERFGKSRRA